MEGEQERERFTHKITQEFDGSLCSIFSSYRRGGRSHLRRLDGMGTGEWETGSQQGGARDSQAAPSHAARRRIASESEELGRRVACRAAPTS